MMDDYKITVGIVLMLINTSILILLGYNIVKCYLKAVNITKVDKKSQLDFYFMEIFASMVFLFANIMALYTGYKSYILNPQMVMFDIVNYRIMDRVGMLIVAICMNWRRTNKNPFNEI